ncbi:MAG: hypothetical protein OEZ34_15690, partial [Spirochaetia bacterium]|nr:hypothetical protein [Spirochaetia bacterium]
VKLFRYAGTAPASTNGTDITTGGWTQQANAGIIGDPVHLYIFSSASAHNYKDGKDYIYITTADSLEAIRVFRQVDIP